MENKLQMTSDDIDQVYKESDSFNVPLLKEAIRQVELKVKDENSRKTRVDSRAFNMLTICMGLITLIWGALNSNFIQNTANTVISLSVTGIFLSIALVLLGISLRSKQYSSLGTMPHTWLIKEYIQGYETDKDNNKISGYVLSHILHNYNGLLMISHQSNTNRIALLDKAILMLSLSFAPIAWNFLSTVISTVI